MPTNMNETSLENLIVNYLVNQNGYELGTSSDYDTTYALDVHRLEQFLHATQEDKVRASRILIQPLTAESFWNVYVKKYQSEV